MLCLPLPGLGNLRLDHRLRDHPPLRVRVRAPRVDRIQTDVQDVPAAEDLGKLRENRVIRALVQGWVDEGRGPSFG